MARNITQLYYPPIAERKVYGDDLIHLGRSFGTDVEKDPVITGAEFYDSMNLYCALVGSPAQQTVTAGVTAPITGYPASGGSAGTPSTGNGTITVIGTGTYRINALIGATGTVAIQEESCALYLQSSLQGDVVIAALDTPTKSQNIVSFAGTFLFTLTAGEVLNLGIACTAGTTFTYANGSFDITPVNLI